MVKLSINSNAYFNVHLKFSMLKNNLIEKVTNDLIKTSYDSSWELKKAIATPQFFFWEQHYLILNHFQSTYLKVNPTKRRKEISYMNFSPFP